MIFYIMFVFWVGRKKYAQILPHFVSIIFGFFFNQTSRKTAQINCQLHKKKYHNVSLQIKFRALL